MYLGLRWKKLLLLILSVSLLGLPIVLLVIRKPQFKSLFPVWKVPSTSISIYSVESAVPGYALTLVDTRYIEYLTGNLRIFDPLAIVDPREYSVKVKRKERYSISNIRFKLVDEVALPISVIIDGDGNTKPVTMLAMGDYQIEGDTLVVRVAVMFDKLPNSFWKGKFSAEDVFLRAAVNALYYAHGEEGPMVTVEELGKVHQNMEKYLYSGLIAWPFRLAEGK